MYLEDKPKTLLSITPIKIKYDCCGKEHQLKWVDADKNFKKNNGKHICRPCWLKSDNNPAKKKENTDKAKKTNLKRYGTTVAMNQQKFIEERKENFKDEEWLAQWNEKRRNTCLDKYGVEHQTQVEEFKENRKQTMLDNWGVENPMQSEEIREKAKQTLLERYGVENASQLPEFREKMYKTTKERYGVRHYNELPEMKDYLREHCREWLAESWANPWSKGITRPEEWNQRQREAVAELIANGEWDVGDRKSLKGTYYSNKCLNKEPKFRSSYELIVHIWLDLNENIDSYDYEPFSISYDYKGIHYYFPDFIIKQKNKEKLWLLEIKNDYAMTLEINNIKDEAAQKYAEKENMTYSLWSNKNINDLNIDLEQYKGKYT